MLEIEQLTVDFGTTRAVDRIDLHVEAGEIVSLLGPNGAGKTTTLRACSRLTEASGSIRFGGTDLGRLEPDAVARHGLIHVPEGRRIFATLTVEENLLVGRSARSGRPERYTLADVYDLFPALGPLARREGWALSGGEQQMVAIGRALLAAPRMLLLDEPSLGLAPIVMREMFRALRAIGADLPMLIVEQNTTAALRISSRAYVLVHGRIELEGASADLADRQTLIGRFLGRRDASAQIHHTTPTDNEQFHDHGETK